MLVRKYVRNNFFYGFTYLDTDSYIWLHFEFFFQACFFFFFFFFDLLPIESLSLFFRFVLFLFYFVPGFLSILSLDCLSLFFFFCFILCFFLLILPFASFFPFSFAYLLVWLSPSSLSFISFFVSSFQFFFVYLFIYLVSLFNGISKNSWFFNTKASLVEKRHWSYFPDRCGAGIRSLSYWFNMITLFKVISQKVNVIVWLKFEFAYFKVAVQHFNHNANCTSLICSLVSFFFYLFGCFISFHFFLSFFAC